MKHICPLCKSEYEQRDDSKLSDKDKYLLHWGFKLGTPEAEEAWKQKQEMTRREAPMVSPDIGGYVSQIDGSWIDSRSKHREHLKKHRMVELGNDVPTKVAPAPQKDPRLTETIGRLVYDKLRYK